MNRYIFTCVVLSVLFAALFIADTNGVFDKTRHPIASVQASIRTVRRLPNNELTWDRAHAGTLLELGDTISTGDRAEAKILFNAGGLLTLDAGSMVALSGNPEELKLNFLTGGAHLEVATEAKDKIKVVQATQAKANPKSKRIRSAVEVTLVDFKSLTQLVPKSNLVIKSELSDPSTQSIPKIQIAPPVLVSPSANYHFPFSKTPRTVTFEWKPASNLNVHAYHVYIETSDGNTLYDEDIKGATKITVPNIVAGAYQWSVFAVSDKNEFSDSSPTQKFNIDDVPKVEWVDYNPVYQYVTPKPSVKVMWKISGSAFPQKSQFKITVTKEGGSAAQVYSTTELTHDFSLASEGLCHEQVEIIGEDGAVISSSPVKDVTVSLLPFLPAPPYSERMPASIQATRAGVAQVSWSEVEGATGYIIRLKDSEDTFLKNEKVVGADFHVVKGLFPGAYKVSLASVDKYNRVGPFGQAKTIQVPDTSDLKGPAVKRFEIK